MNTVVGLNLAHNENFYGPAPRCLDVLREATAEDLYSYAPNFRAGTPSPLLARLAADNNVDPTRVVLAYGAEDILKTALGHVLTPGGTLLAPSVSWPYYQVLADGIGARVLPYPVEEDPYARRFTVDIDALLAARSRHMIGAVLIASPNNPTGDLFPTDRLHEVLDAYAGTPVILDEAYLGLGEREADPRISAALTERHPHLLVIRTFSKLYGLAGARIGYAVGGTEHAALTSRLARYLGYHRLSEKLALAALDDPGYYRRVRASISAERALLRARLAAHPGVTAYRSHANFVLLRFDPAAEHAVRAALTGAGIAVKWMTGALAGCARVTIGTPDQNAALTATLDTALQTSESLYWVGSGHGPAAARFALAQVGR